MAGRTQLSRRHDTPRLREEIKQQLGFDVIELDVCPAMTSPRWFNLECFRIGHAPRCLIGDRQLDEGPHRSFVRMRELRKYLAAHAKRWTAEMVALFRVRQRQRKPAGGVP